MEADRVSHLVLDEAWRQQLYSALDIAFSNLEGLLPVGFNDEPFYSYRRVDDE